MKNILAALAILVMFGSMKEHTPSPCAGGKLLIKDYYKGKLVHTDYTGSQYAEWNTIESAKCLMHKKYFTVDSTIVEIVK